MTAVDAGAVDDWPLSRYVVVVPAMVTFTAGIAPELAHEA